MDQAERRAWAQLLVGVKPAPKGKRSLYVGVLDQAWVKQTFGRGRPLSRTALMGWRKRGIPPEHIPRMIEELRRLLPDTTKEPWPEWARALRADVLAAIREAGQTASADRAAHVGVEAETRHELSGDGDPDEATEPTPARE